MTATLDTTAILEQADALIAARRHHDAIEFLRPNLAAAGSSDAVAVKFAALSSEVGRHEEAVTALSSRAERRDASLSLLTALGVALQGDRRLEAAIAVFQRARALAPTSGVAEHNLAAAFGDGHWFQEAEAASARALGLGLNAPETWQVRARALQGLGRFDEAEQAFREVIARRPNDPDAHGELAQQIWMRGEDMARATAMLDAARSRDPADAGLARARAKLLGGVGDHEGAYAVFSDALMRPGVDPLLNADAALAASWFDPERAVIHAERAVAIDPWRGEVMTALCQAYLAAGHPAEALQVAEAMHRVWPNDQFAKALLGMAWRMLDDPRYRELYDYDRLVRSYRLDTPDGWPSLSAWVADLAAALGNLHQMRAHPIGQSLRNGTQTAQSLDRLDIPAIRGLFRAIDGPIRAYIAALDQGGEALGRRIAPSHAYRFDKAWSIRLKPQGFHVNHLHPKGWISSACHLGVPAAVGQGHEGWLSFGEPGLPTRPHLPAEHFVRPQEGHVVLFPSYMWHGTVPFSGPDDRLSAAFDVIPG
jgi:tetratricopeptide (TPR) repeat protein